MVSGESAAAITAFSVTVSPRSVRRIVRLPVTKSVVAWYESVSASTWRPNAASPVKCGSTVRFPRLQPPANGSRKSAYWCSSGPKNIITVRVRLAASTSIDSSFSRAGGVISRSLSSSQRVFTPIEFSTSIIRFTSSIRATRRSVVLPLFSRLAHSKPTAAFLLVLIYISPDSCLPPCTRKFILPERFSVTILQ